MKCQKCGKSAQQIKCLLKRVNPKGEVGVWKCYPKCGAKLSLSKRIDLALSENFDSEGGFDEAD